MRGWLRLAPKTETTFILQLLSETALCFLFCCHSSFSGSSKKWQEKAELLTRLESQVKRMKDNFDSKERLLLEERDKATEAHKYVIISEESKSLFKTVHPMGNRVVQLCSFPVSWRSGNLLPCSRELLFSSVQKEDQIQYVSLPHKAIFGQ